MKNLIIALAFFLPFSAGAQIIKTTKASSLTIDSLNVFPGVMFDIIADTNWYDARCTFKVTGYTIDGQDSVILDAGGYGSVFHIWLSSDTLDTDFASRTETQEAYLSEVTGDTTAKKGTWLPVNSTGGTVTISMPTPVKSGDWIGVIDSRGTSASNNITLDSSGDKLNGSIADYVISTNGISVKLVYLNSTIGWVPQR